MKLKNNILSLAFGLLTVCTLSAQKQVELTGLAGYAFSSRFDISGGYGKFSDGTVYGGTIGVKLAHKSFIEVLYTHEVVDAEYNYYYNYNNYYGRDIPVGINYLQLGINRVKELGAAQKAEVFGGLNLGAAWLNPESDQAYTYDTRTLFAFGLNLGTKIWLTDRIGIRLQSTLQVPVQYLGLSIFAGTGGTAVGVSSFSSIEQFSFLGGLVIRLPEKP